MQLDLPLEPAIVWRQFGRPVLQGTLGSRWGMVGLLHNEAYLMMPRDHRLKTAPYHKHLGTFKTLEEAKGAVETALRRTRP